MAFNTFFALLTQDDQLRCMTNAAARLEPGGRFLIEAFVPDLARFDRGQRTASERVGTDLVALEVSTHDISRQHVTSAHVLLRESGTAIYPVQIRYCWPSELDLMARLPGSSSSTDGPTGGARPSPRPAPATCPSGGGRDLLLRGRRPSRRPLRALRPMSRARRSRPAGSPPPWRRAPVDRAQSDEPPFSRSLVGFGHVIPARSSLTRPLGGR